jgi:5-methylcytosine-specific restriction endonuclease McrA
MTQVLVLDPMFKPVDLYSVRDAAWDLAQEKAISGVELGLPGATVIAVIRTATRAFEIPSVIMLKWAVRLPKSLSRRVTNPVLFARDNWTCQYCGTHERDLPMIHITVKGKPSVRKMFLTRDHVKPQSLFKKKDHANTWDNVVTACEKCNNKKDDKLPYQCGMYPIKTPKKPTWLLFTFADKLTPEQSALIASMGYQTY